jgi:hypothetical protein
MHDYLVRTKKLIEIVLYMASVIINRLNDIADDHFKIVVVCKIRMTATAL